MKITSVTGKTIDVVEEYLRVVKDTDREAAKICPACGIKGVRVLPVTIATHVDPKYWDLIKEGIFYFSMTPECPMTYYNNVKRIYFLKDEIKTRFGPKENEPPRPICYCLQVTEERIAEEIMKKRCCDSLEDIVAYTKAGTGKWCLTTNPSGKCCREYLDDVVDKYLKITTEEDVKLLLREVRTRTSEPLRRVELEVRGMTCESCALAVKNIIENVGGRDVSVSLKTGKAEAIIPISVNVQYLVSAINESGYEALVRRVERSR